MVPSLSLDVGCDESDEIVGCNHFCGTSWSSLDMFDEEWVLSLSEEVFV